MVELVFRLINMIIGENKVANYCCFRLRDVLEADQFEHLGIFHQPENEFPDSITLDQTVSLWKHIVDYQEKLKKQE